jgi:hypothetical protein
MYSTKMLLSLKPPAVPAAKVRGACTMTQLTFSSNNCRVCRLGLARRQKNKIALLSIHYVRV